MKDATVELLEHRMRVLEEQVTSNEVRLRALEIAHARLIGYAAGGAFIGGLVFQALTWALK
jgi:hypothetical protein